MFVRCPIAQVMNVQFDDPLLMRPLHNAFAQRSAADFRKQRDDVDSHCRKTSNAERRTSTAKTAGRLCEPRKDSGLTQTRYISFHNLEHRALAVTRCRTGQQGANSVNGLTRPANNTAHISASKLQFKDDHSAAGNFREHHIIRKFDTLANDELEKFSHPSKN